MFILYFANILFLFISLGIFWIFLILKLQCRMLNVDHFQYVSCIFLYCV